MNGGKDNITEGKLDTKELVDNKTERG